MEEYRKYKEEILSKFSGFPKLSKYDINKDYDYYMYCALQVIQHLKEKRSGMPIHAQMYAIIVLPELLHTLNYKLTRDEWSEYKKSLQACSDELFGEDSTSSTATKIRNFLAKDYSKYGNEKSSLAEFNYLYGLTPDTSRVDKEFSSLDKSFGYLFVNANHHLEKEDSIIMYREIPKMQTKLLNKDTLKDYVPYDSYPVKKVDKSYYLIESGAGKWKVGIDYNNGYYTLFKEEFTKEGIDRIIAGEVCGSISPIRFEIELYKKWLYKELDNKRDMSAYGTLLTKITNIVRESFSKDKFDTAKKLLKKLHPFIEHPSEEKYFKYYVENVATVNDWTLERVHDYILDYYRF